MVVAPIEFVVELFGVRLGLENLGAQCLELAAELTTPSVGFCVGLLGLAECDDRGEELGLDALKLTTRFGQLVRPLRQLGRLIHQLGRLLR